MATAKVMSGGEEGGHFVMTLQVEMNELPGCHSWVGEWVGGCNYEFTYSATLVLTLRMKFYPHTFCKIEEPGSLM